jgi:Ca-activated chloride channel family protein
MVTQAAIFAGVGALLLVMVIELWHLRRIRRVAALAFGPKRKPAAWVSAVPVIRGFAAGLFTFGTVSLFELEPVSRSLLDAKADKEMQHLVIVLDVSPSMLLDDAGPDRTQRRSQRARDLLRSMFERVSIGSYKLSVIATYNGAKPVVIDTKDGGVVDNILGDLPLRYAFSPGKTRLFDGIGEAAKIAKEWRAESAILLLVTDGDTVPPTGMPKLPPAYRSVLVVGVGDPTVGKFIDGRQSRQDSSTLQQIAARLRGLYHNGNERHIPTDMVREVTRTAEATLLEKLTLREYALMAVALGSLVLCALPFLLLVAGSSWRAGRRSPVGTGDANDSSRLAGRSSPAAGTETSRTPARVAPASIDSPSSVAAS